MGYQLIETITVGAGGVTDVTFSNIDQDGIDLICLVSGRSNSGGVFKGCAFRYNGITTNTYRNVLLSGDGSSAYASDNLFTYWTVQANGSTSTANTFSNIEFRISNYTASAAKSASIDGVFENNATNAYIELLALSETGTDPVTSLLVGLSDFVEHSTISLYKTTAD